MQSLSAKAETSLFSLKERSAKVRKRNLKLNVLDKIEFIERDVRRDEATKILKKTVCRNRREL